MKAYASGRKHTAITRGYAFTKLHYQVLRTCTSQNSIDNKYDFVSLTKMKKLIEKSKLTYSEGYTNLTFSPFCSKNTCCKAYLNKVSGYFTCYGCDIALSWKDLENSLITGKNLNSEDFKDLNLLAGKKYWHKIKSNLINLKNSSEIDTISKRLGINLSKICSSLDIYLDKNCDLYIPLTRNNDIVGFKVLKIDNKEDSFPPLEAGGILKINKNSSSAIIVHQMLDFLTLASEKNDYDIICLPNGQYSLPQSTLPLFENYSKIILWFGSDSISWDNAKQFARKLKEDRCYLVKPVESHSTAFIASKNQHNISEILNNSKKIFHGGITTFAVMREEIISEIFNEDKITGVKWVRFPALNNVLRGHRRGELTIFTGPTGAGKTTFISEYSLDLAMQKVPTLWGSFEIRNQRLAKNMLQQFAGEPLESIEKFNIYADKFQHLPIYFMTFHGQQSLETVMEAVEHSAYVHDVAHVIIDNVQFMLGLSNTEAGFLDRFYRQDALIGAFRNFATTRNCHVTLVIHPRKEKDGELLSANSIFGGAKASQEADNVLIIQNKTLSQGFKTKKYLQIVKNRFSGDLGMMPLNFNKAALSFSKPAQTLNQNAS